MKALSLSLLCTFILMASNAFAKNVKVSFYGLTQVFDGSKNSAYGPLFSRLQTEDKKIQVSVRGSRANSSVQCASSAPQLDLEITDLGNGRSRFEVLPTTQINGKKLSETGYLLNSFDVMALEPAHSSVHALAISLKWVNPKDTEEAIDFHLNVNELTATLRSRVGDDDSAKVYEMIALKADLNEVVDEVRRQVMIKCD